MRQIRLDSNTALRPHISVGFGTVRRYTLRNLAVILELMPYAVEPTVEGVRIFFSRRRFSWATALMGGVTAALWVGYFNNHSRRWPDLILPGIFLAMFAASLIKKE